jgi:hypothetical protein
MAHNREKRIRMVIYLCIAGQTLLGCSCGLEGFRRNGGGVSPFPPRLFRLVLSVAGRILSLGPAGRKRDQGCSRPSRKARNFKAGSKPGRDVNTRDR